MYQMFEEELVMAEPIIFCHFAEGVGDPKYMPIRDWPHLEKLLTDALLNYNELVHIKHIFIQKLHLYFYRLSMLS